MNFEKIKSPIGMNDFFGEKSELFAHLVKEFANQAKNYGYSLIITPLVEHVEVFNRLGKDTDVVSKEMYNFVDKGGRELVLKPESSAAVARSFVQHNPDIPWKVWYLSPQFRYERPQKGRYRQHFQLGVEILGATSFQADVEVIHFLYNFFNKIGLGPTTELNINTMGSIEERPKYKELLLTYFKKHEADLTNSGQWEKALNNPIRMLDSKVESLQGLLNDAPSIKSVSTKESLEKYEQVLQTLTDCGVEYVENSRLVRGFDYYSDTTFEFVSSAIDAAQSTIAGGGSYNKLVEELGGKPTPGIGFGAGVERWMLALENLAKGTDQVLPTTKCDVFVVGDDSLTAPIVMKLREANLSVLNSLDDKSFKAQFKQANKANAKLVVIYGADENTRSVVNVKCMETGNQDEVSLENLVQEVKQRL
jgi:histidyl-tRNA synthetase